MKSLSKNPIVLALLALAIATAAPAMARQQAPAATGAQAADNTDTTVSLLLAASVVASLTWLVNATGDSGEKRIYLEDLRADAADYLAQPPGTEPSPRLKSVFEQTREFARHRLSPGNQSISGLNDEELATQLFNSTETILNLTGSHK